MMPKASKVFQAAGRDSTVTFLMGSAEIHLCESATWGFRGQDRLSAYRQKFFVETANLARAIDKVNLEDPVSFLSIFADAAHANRIVRMNIQRDLISGNSLMRKMPDQMSSDRSAIFPAIFCGEFVGGTIQLVRPDVGMALEVLLPIRKRLLNIVAKLELHRIGAHDKRAPEIRFPFLEHGTEIEKQNVVRTNLQIGRILIVGGERISSGAHNACVPIRRNPVHLMREVVDVLIELALGNARADESFGLDGVEEFVRFLLGLQQRRGAAVFECVHATRLAREFPDANDPL